MDFIFKNVLVPLDGSRFGEQALAYAESLARQYDGRITLVHVVPAGWPAELRAEAPEVETQALQSETHDATDYLRQQEARLRQDGLAVTALILKGEPIHRLILEAVETESADVIVMSTHGFTGIKRLMFGNVAEKVISKAPVPILLIRPPADD